jgi:hypothetical protein
MGDFLRFETMITPVLIQVVFWLAVIVCVIVGIVMIVSGGETAGRVGGLLLIVLGPIAARIYAEILIVLFRINDHLRHIQHNTERV